MIRVDEEDFEAVRHLLPESVLALITIIGLTETVELVKNLGGTTYPLRQGRTKGSESRLAYLEEIVGGAAMEKMVEALAPCDLFIPKNMPPNTASTAKPPPSRAARCVFAAQSVRQCRSDSKSMSANRCI